MKTIYTYYKNSNTGVIIMKQEFTETKITGIPLFYYDSNKKSIDIPNLKGFVEISEKKFNKEAKKQNK